METKKFIDGIETVEKVKWLLPSLTNIEMYMYGDVSVEADKEVLRISALRSCRSRWKSCINMKIRWI